MLAAAGGAVCLPASTPPPAASLAADPDQLVADAAPRAPGTLPGNFRIVARLHAAGSAQFSLDGFAAARARLPGPVTLFDLRQESHGYVDGEPVSWFLASDPTNGGKGPSAVMADEKARLGSCAANGFALLSASKAKPGSAAPIPTTRIAVGSVRTEAELAEAAGVAYIRIPVSNHRRPAEAAIDLFIRSVRALPATDWAYFHCHAGGSRTTTFLVLYDMLRNAREVSLPDIVSRQALLAGGYNVLTAYPGDRAVFIRQFYRYAQANPHGHPQLWTEWLKSQPEG